MEMDFNLDDTLITHLEVCQCLKSIKLMFPITDTKCRFEFTSLSIIKKKTLKPQNLKTYDKWKGKHNDWYEAYQIFVFVHLHWRLQHKTSLHPLLWILSFYTNLYINFEVYSLHTKWNKIKISFGNNLVFLSFFLKIKHINTIFISNVFLCYIP